MAGKATSTKSKGKATKTKAPEPEVELDEVDSDEVEAEAGTKGGTDDVVFGASDLAKHLSEKSGKTVTTRELRTLIRKMARDGSGRVDREIVPGNRTRYSWSGIDDPEVKAIIKAFDGGELEDDKKAKLAKLKADKAAKKAAGEDTGKKGKKGKGKKADKAPEPEAADDDSDGDDGDEDLELDG